MSRAAPRQREQQYRRLVEVSRLPGINIQNSLRATLQLQALGKSGEDATEVIREFGNALALSGTAPRELNQVINAIRQMSGEGKILQEDIAIITTRVARLIPILQDAFGGTRAEDVRQFFDAMGVDESEQADRFLRIVLDRLKELPRSSETAANAIENLQDTTQRVQAAIGASFLPLVRETTAAAEGFLMQIERSPEITRTIAILEGLTGTFLTVTAAGVGLAAALPAMGATILSLGAPILGPIAVIGGVAAAFVALRIAAEQLETPTERLNQVLEQNAASIRALNRAAADSQNIRRLRQSQQQLVEEQQSLQDALTDTRTRLIETQEAFDKYLLRVRSSAQGLQSILDPADIAAPDIPTNAPKYQALRTQLTLLGKQYAELQQQTLGYQGAASRIGEELDPLVESQVNVENLTKSIADLKEELQEEVVFEDVSRDLLGSEVDFQKSATALADIEVLIKLNTDAYGKLENAAASGNQEAVKGLSAINKELNTLRDAAADRHIDNLSTAFENLTKTTDLSRKQFEAILKSAEAFVATFQGGAAVLQDDVGQVR